MKELLADILTYGAPPRQARLSSQVYDRIFGLIVSGEFPVKSKLPTEAELADSLKVSRTIVREALARLRDDGIIVSRQGAGTFVLRRPDKAILGFQPVGSIADVQRCFEFRTALEGEAAFIAAVRRDSGRTAEIARALETLEEIVKQSSIGAGADYEFHHAVARASCNSFFVSTVELLHPHIEFGMNLTRSLSLRRPRSRVRQVQDEHARVYEAIDKGDADNARAAMRTHIENARRRMFEEEPTEVEVDGKQQRKGRTTAAERKL